MRDRETNSIWAHINGTSVSGPMVGQRLEMVPLPQMTWKEWQAVHPATTILDSDTPYQRHYRKVQIGQPSANESIHGDDRLESHELVVGVEAQGKFVGFPIQTVADLGGVVNTMIGDVPVLVIFDINSQTGIAYDRSFDQQILHFEKFRNKPMYLIDKETSSKWNIDGVAVDGAMVGTELKFLPSFVSEWYGWSAYHPSTEIYRESADIE